MTPNEELSGHFAAAARGEREAMRAIYDRTAPRLFGIALRILRDKVAATAVLKQTFATVFRDAGSFERAADPLSQLVVQVREAALDRLRADTSAGPVLDPFESDSDIEDPLGDLPRSPALQRLLACLGHLPEERRRMILYAYYDGWSREALSIYFDAPTHAVNTWVWRSIAELDACVST